MKELVFVYGTLKQGRGNNYLFQDSAFVGEGITKDKYVLTNAGFPYMCPLPQDERAKPVFGHVFEVTKQEVMDDLDSLEGVSYGHYERRLHVINIEGGQVEAWSYTPCDVEDASKYHLCDSDEQGYYVY